MSPALPTDWLCLPRVCLLGVLALTISWGTLGLELAVSVVSGRVWGWLGVVSPLPVRVLPVTLNRLGQLCCYLPPGL